MPLRAVGPSTSLIAPAMSEVTSVPAGLVASSSIGLSEGVRALLSDGASLIGLIAIVADLKSTLERIAATSIADGGERAANGPLCLIPREIV